MKDDNKKVSQQVDLGGPHMGEADHFELTDDIHQKLFAIGVNVLVIVYLFIAMFFAAQDQANLTPVFFKVFFSFLIPTLLISFIVKRKLRARQRM